MVAKEIKVGLLTLDEVNEKKGILGNFIIDQLGANIYQLPDGSLCGEEIWKEFNRALKFQLIDSTRGFKGEF